MAKTRLSAATYVERGYGQVEPNHLSAQRTGQIYAQLPADKSIDVLENGQFVKYDYANGVVNYTGKGEWMLVFNEVKVYHDYEGDADFAMIKGNYGAKIYSPVGASTGTASARDYSSIATAADPYIPDSTANPFVVETYGDAAAMPEGTTMVPRVFKTNIGDIFTTNTIKEEGTLALGDILVVGDDGYLKKFVADAGEDASKTPSGMQWEVCKVYTMPDRQKAVKIMRIA